jgi:hypothetical protein
VVSGIVANQKGCKKHLKIAESAKSNKDEFNRSLKLAAMRLSKLLSQHVGLGDGWVPLCCCMCTAQLTVACAGMVWVSVLPPATTF